MGLFSPGLGWSKVWYFETFATSALLYPLLNLYLRRRGLSETQIGVVAALRPWVSAVAGNLWAGLGDYTGLHKNILLFSYSWTVTLRYCIGLSGHFTWVLFFVGLAEAMSAPLLILADASSMASSRREGDYGKARMWGAIGWGAFSPVAGIIVSHLGSHALFEANLAGGVLGLLPTALLPTKALKEVASRRSAAAEATYTPPLSCHSPPQTPRLARDCRLGSSTDLEENTGGIISLDDKHSLLSRRAAPDAGGPAPPQPRDERLAGTQACDLEQPVEPPHLQAEHAAVASGAAGEALQPEDILTTESRSFEFYDVPPVAPSPEIIDYSQVASLARHPDLPEAVTLATSPAPSAAAGMMQKLGRIFADAEVVIFFGMTILYGFAAGCIDGYVFLYLDQLGAPEALMGLTITVACLVEMPVFHYMGGILAFVGVERMLHWVLFFFLIRLGYYTMLGRLPTPWLILPVETLNGITFGCAWAAGTVNCSRIAPPGLEATTQAIFSGLYMGLGLGLGGLFGGVVYNYHGPVATFASAFVVVLLGWLLCVLSQQVTRCTRRKLRARKSATNLHKPLLNTEEPL